MNPVLVAVADLHVGKTAPEDVAAMVSRIEAEVRRDGRTVAAVLALGDLGESLGGIAQALALLAPLAPVRVLVPGNHDLFDTERIGSSMERHDVVLPGLAGDHGWVWGVSDTPLVLGGTAVVATPAWPRPELVIAGRAFDRRAVREAWQELPDARWITPDLRPEVLSDRHFQLFRRALGAVPPGVGRLVVATHFPIRCSQLDGDPSPATPWFVSPRFGEELRLWADGHPDTVVELVSGHLHRGVDDWDDGMRVRVIDSGYGRPGFSLIDAG